MKEGKLLQMLVLPRATEKYLPLHHHKSTSHLANSMYVCMSLKNAIVTNVHITCANVMLRNVTTRASRKANDTA